MRSKYKFGRRTLKSTQDMFAFAEKIDTLLPVSDTTGTTYQREWLNYVLKRHECQLEHIKELRVTSDSQDLKNYESHYRDLINAVRKKLEEL